jgi:large subunit ribosomal protein L6
VSRIGKQPVVIPPGVKVSVSGGAVKVEGPQGKVSASFRPEVRITLDEPNKRVVVGRTGETKFARAYHGTTRALIANMVEGASKGFPRNLEIVGVGYNAKVQGKKLVLQVGFCHPVEIPIPEGIKVVIPQPTRIELVGADKQVVGEFAARIRRIRPPEPYKGKGIRYEGEHIIKKAGKAFGSGT